MTVNTMKTKQHTPSQTDLALRAAQQSGVCIAHGDQRQANAFERAARLILQRHPAAKQPDGSYRVASAEQPALEYTVRAVGGVIVCDCPAGHWGKACKHAALVETVEAG